MNLHQIADTARHESTDTDIGYLAQDALTGGGGSIDWNTIIYGLAGVLTALIVVVAMYRAFKLFTADGGTKNTEEHSKNQGHLWMTAGVTTACIWAAAVVINAISGFIRNLLGV
ncbi:hypothetical protein EEB14_33965 [Rhodococcus sp. WS4]|nr:hypothetical protein EEB14_33965 [Rhodococcus sp. WS4]